MLISISSKASGVVLICLVSVTEKGKKKKKGLAKSKIGAGMESSSNGESFAFPWHKMVYVFNK